MKTSIILLLASIVLYSCSKDDVELARPIKKDVTAPIVTMSQPGEFVQRASNITAIINATDDMGLKSVYYYENGVLSRY